MSFFTQVEEMKQKLGNILFNDTLNIFYVRLYGVKHY